MTAIFFISRLSNDSGIKNHGSFRVFSRSFVCQPLARIVFCSSKVYTKILTHRLVAQTSERNSIVLDAGRPVLRSHHVSYYLIPFSLKVKAIPNIAKNAAYSLTGTNVNIIMENNEIATVLTQENHTLVFLEPSNRIDFCPCPWVFASGKNKTKGQTLIFVFCTFYPKLNLYNCQATNKESNRLTILKGLSAKTKFNAKTHYTTGSKFGASAILTTRSVLAGTESKYNQPSGQRQFSTKIIDPVTDPYFESMYELIEQIQKGIWPKNRLATKMELDLNRSPKRYLYICFY